MSNEVPVAFVQQFKDNYIILAQQETSRLRRAVRDDPDFLKGKSGFFDRIGATAMKKKTGRHADTPLMNTPHSRRRLTMDDFNWADLIDSADRIRLLADPTGPYTTNAVFSANRQMDTIIYDAMGSVAYSVDEDDAASSSVFPAANKVAVNNHTFDAGSGDVGLTVGKLIAAKQLLMANEVPEGMPMFCVADSLQLSKLLAETEVQSRDFNDIYALVQGNVSSFMGFDFIRKETLTADASSDTLVYCWAPPAIGLGIGEELMIDVGPRRDKSLSTQIYLEFAAGATRVQDELIVEIACDPS